MPAAETGSILVDAMYGALASHGQRAGADPAIEIKAGDILGFGVSGHLAGLLQTGMK